MIFSRFDSPLGEILLTGDGLALTGLYTRDHPRRPAVVGEPDDVAFAEVRRQLTEYFAGSRLTFDLPLAARGTDFQHRVWAELQRIGYGDTASYRKVATRLGDSKAVRAVGVANGRNPISIVVPCHRVVGHDGSLTGYAGGLTAKKWLLDHEAAHRAG